MSITLTSPLNISSGIQARLAFIGVNYAAQRVALHVEWVNAGGAVVSSKDYIVSNDPGALETITALSNSVANFLGLRLGVETHLAAIVPELAGVAS